MTLMELAGPIQWTALTRHGQAITLRIPKGGRLILRPIHSCDKGLMIRMQLGR